MTRSVIAPPLCVALASVFLIAAAPEDSTPSALVTLTALQKGSVPKRVTAYGKVEPSASAQQTIMAPVSATIGEIYVRPGVEVAKGAALIRLVPSPKTTAAYAQAKSALLVAGQLVERTKKLVGGHLATGQQLAEAEKSEDDARSVLAALDALGGDKVQILRAPFPAIVLGLSTSQGAMVGEGAPLLDLADPSGLVLRVGVVPERAAAIKPGDKAELDAIGGREKFAGTVVLRGSIVEPENGMVPVDIGIPPGALLPGTMAEAAITTGETQGYVVPHQAILVDDSGDTYVVQSVNLVAKKIAVDILGSDGDRDIVDGPFDAAAPVVLDGNYQLQNGMKLRLSNSDAKSKE